MVPTLQVAQVWVWYCIWYTRATLHTHTTVSWVLTGICYNFLLILTTTQMQIIFQILQQLTAVYLQIKLFHLATHAVCVWKGLVLIPCFQILFIVSPS